MDEAKGIWVADKETVCGWIMRICEEYRRQGYTMTLRQLYYQLVARDIIPNHDKVYAKISAIKDDLVYSGRIDWNVFEDRGRVPKQAYYEDDVAGALQRTINSYRLDRQLNQKNHIEVWTEKDAISNILRRVTDEYTVMLSINKGYTSSTAVYGAYERFVSAIENGQKVKILYFGDHDPSGIDMIRDIRDRVMLMLTQGERLINAIDDKINSWWQHNGFDIYDVVEFDPDKYEKIPRLFNEGSEELDTLFDAGRMEMYIKEHELFEIIPVGLTMEQIRLYNPPHNPAKITDPRAKGYVKKYGSISWEVDALTPDVMISIVDSAIKEHLDLDVLAAVKEREAAEIEKITAMIESL